MEPKQLVEKAIAKAGSQKNLASVVAVTPETVNRWTKGTLAPSPRKYGALLRYVGVPYREAVRLVGERELGAEEDS